MSEEVRHAMFEAAKDKEVRVIILTGSGRAFCAGADMEELRTVAREGISGLSATEKESQIRGLEVRKTTG